MDAHDQNGAQAHALAAKLDPGLSKASGRDRLARLRENLTPRDASQEKLDVGRLELLGKNLAKKTIRLSVLLQQYYAATDSGRWPIIVVKPETPDKLRNLERNLVGTGFTVEQSLASAYRKVAMLPVRVPPEQPVMEALALMDNVARVERSWLTGSTPEPGPADDRPITHPDNLLNRDILPSELLSKRDPLRIGLIDSGIDATHPALKTRLLDQRAFRRGLSGVGDQLGHGTATAGIIARLCTAATFLSAKVVDADRRANLDDLIRAVGWLKHRPDLVVCNVLLPIPASGTSILSTLLSSLVDQGVVVVVPALDTVGEIATPGNTQGVISVATLDASTASAAKVRANGHHVLAPRSIQAKEPHFPKLDYPSWTIFSGPAAAAAITAGTAGLLLRVARMRRHDPQPDEIVRHILSTAGEGPLKPDAVVNAYMGKLVAPDADHLEKNTAPVFQALRPNNPSTARPVFNELPTAISEDLPPELFAQLGVDSDLTQPLTDEAKRAMAELHRRSAQQAAPSGAFSEEEAATVQGEIPEHVLKMMEGTGDADDEADRPEWWPETEEVSIEGVAGPSGTTEGG